jgi:hypothetical protein
VVIEQVQDLHLAVVGQGPMGDVQLPALVGLLGHEPHIAALGPLVRLGGDEPAGVQDPPDRRDRRCAAVPLAEVEGDGGRAGLVPATGQLLAELDDLVLDLDRRAPGTSQRPAGPRRQPGLALSQISLHNCGIPIAHSSAQGVNNVSRQL